MLDRQHPRQRRGVRVRLGAAAEHEQPPRVLARRGDGRRAPRPPPCAGWSARCRRAPPRARASRGRRRRRPPGPAARRRRSRASPRRPPRDGMTSSSPRPSGDARRAAARPRGRARRGAPPRGRRPPRRRPSARDLRRVEARQAHRSTNPVPNGSRGSRTKRCSAVRNAVPSTSVRRPSSALAQHARRERRPDDRVVAADGVAAQLPRRAARSGRRSPSPPASGRPRRRRTPSRCARGAGRCSRRGRCRRSPRAGRRRHVLRRRCRRARP